MDHPHRHLQPICHDLIGYDDHDDDQMSVDTVQVSNVTIEEEPNVSATGFDHTTILWIPFSLLSMYTSVF